MQKSSEMQRQQQEILSQQRLKELEQKKIEEELQKGSSYKTYPKKKLNLNAVVI